jgi:hypothetical protein
VAQEIRHVCALDTRGLAATEYYGGSVCTAEELAAGKYWRVSTAEDRADQVSWVFAHWRPANQLLLLTTSCSLSVTQATGLAQWLEGPRHSPSDSELMVLAVLVNLCNPYSISYAQPEAPAEVDMHAMRRSSITTVCWSPCCAWQPANALTKGLAASPWL